LTPEGRKVINPDANDEAPSFIDLAIRPGVSDTRAYFREGLMAQRYKSFFVCDCNLFSDDCWAHHQKWFEFSGLLFLALPFFHFLDGALSRTYELRFVPGKCCRRPEPAKAASKG
jgi:hypothetical protein